MTTSMGSADLLTGFLSEAREYVDALRECLEAEETNGNSNQIAEAHQQMSILQNSAEMLELTEIAALAEPATELLKEKLDTEAQLSDSEGKKLASTLDQMEAYLNTLTGDSERKPEGSKKPRKTGPLPSAPTELLGIFAMEAQEHLTAVQAGMEKLRDAPDDKPLMSEIRRVTHTLKGAAASVGFNTIARMSHLMEELLEQRIDNNQAVTPDEIDLLFDSADALNGLIEPDSNKNIDGLPDSAEDVDRLIEAIDSRYELLLGKAYPQKESGGAQAVDESAALPQDKLTESFLRLSQASIDLLINRLGEIVINRSSLERYLSDLRGLLAELDYSSRRLHRVAHDIDLQIELSPLVTTGKFADGDSSFDPIELDRYTLLYQLTRELEEAVTDTRDVNKQLQFLASDFDTSLSRERRLTNDMQDSLMATRLVSFHEIETRLRRTVRRTARDLGKSVDLVLAGFETTVDKSILDTLSDPLMHLLRNAIDHGIEMPEDRLAAGKPETGLVTLTVTRQRGRVILTLTDDGRGIDSEALRTHAAQLGLITETETATDEDLLELLFEEGLSLAKTVTQTSGRGVGLNIVRRAVSQLQGNVRIESTPQSGSTFTISVPVTLAITRALYVNSTGQTFAIPLEQISAVVRLQPEQQQEIAKNKVLHHEGDVLAVYPLTWFIEGTTESGIDSPYGLVVGTGRHETVVLVDGLVGTSEAVVKSLGTHLRRVLGVSGATISGTGQVVLILDLVEIVTNKPEKKSGGKGGKRRSSRESSVRHALVVDDSLSVRRVVCSFLKRVGWQATAVKDGIDAMEQLAHTRPDVMLVDIEMPRMNGYELLSQIRSDPKLKNIPVVFLTSRSASKHRNRAEELKVDGYIVKPYREDQLLETLNEVTQK
ncbi:MAG: response regulator [Anaerolineae bacterium]|nr:response regulator [Anaerolineae bacterium]